MRRKALILLAVLLALTLLTGCSKDQVVEGYSKGVEWLGDLPVVLSLRLQGEREWGEDHYTGTYTAQYSDFTGQECLFGGTRLEARDAITISCSLEGEEGSAELRFRSIGGDTQVLCSADAQYTGTLELPAGGGYIGFTGKGLTGTLNVALTRCPEVSQDEG